MKGSILFHGTDISSHYDMYRPVYPASLFQLIVDFIRESHSPNTSGKFPVAVDVGCGPGKMSTVPLATHFNKVLGVDTSRTQIDLAKKNQKLDELEFRVAVAEHLPVENSTVTLVQAAATLHWLKPQKFFKECDRVLVPGGVIAAFCYHGPLIIVNHANAESMNSVMKEISEKIYNSENAWFTETSKAVLGKYTDEILQIPYKDKRRFDDKKLDFDTTISGFQKFLMTLTFISNYVKSSDSVSKWWNSCLEKFVEASGEEDLESPLTYRANFFLTLGRKPLSEI